MGGVFSLTGSILSGLVFICIMVGCTAEVTWKQGKNEEVMGWWMIFWMSLWILTGSLTVFLGALTAYLWGAIGH